MAFRLSVRLDDRTLRLPLAVGENLVGSHPECEVTLPDPTVSRHHAVIVVGEERIEAADLSSENGTFVDGRSLRGKTRLAPGARLAFGTVEAELEEVADDDLVRGTAAPASAPGTEPSSEPGRSVDLPGAGDRSTASVGSVQRWALEALPELVASVAESGAASGSAGFAGRVGTALSQCLPVLGVQVETTRGGVLFTDGEAPPDPLPADGGPAEGRGHWIRIEGGGMVVVAGFPSAGIRSLHEPILRTAHGLLRSGTESGGTVSPSTEEARGAEGERGAPWPDPPTVDPEVRAIYRRAERVARGDVHVLIRGESGTGKEVLARFIHRASRRADGPFVTLNCAALPADLQESELFGIERGVATGVEARPGRFELAHGGTLFLDEIGDMAAATQAKILRALQEGEVYRLGASRPRPADIRIISATNRDLGRLRTDGAFRDDLYHRIADWEVELPPLRHRPADIPNLAAWFLEREAGRLDRPLDGISRRALDTLVAHPWPGNIRQLEREIARAVLFTEPGELVETGALSEEVASTADTAPGDLKSRVERFERNEIRRTLELHGGNVPEAAEALGLSASTLYRKLNRYGLTAED